MARYGYGFAVFVVICGVFPSVWCADVDYQNTKVWGLGLDSSARLPVRYVFVQPYDKNNKK